MNDVRDPLDMDGEDSGRRTYVTHRTGEGLSRAVVNPLGVEDEGKRADLIELLVSELVARGIEGVPGEDGASVELRIDGGWVQWRVAGDATWTNLIELASLQGPQGDPGPTTPATTTDIGAVKLSDTPTDPLEPVAVVLEHLLRHLGSFKEPVRLATAAPLPAYTAVDTQTLVANANGALVVDGVAVAQSDRVLYKNGVGGTKFKDNGIFVVTDPGSAGSPWVLTRASDMNDWSKVPRAFIRAGIEGVANANGEFVTGFTVPNTGTIGVTNLSFSQVYLFTSVSGSTYDNFPALRRLGALTGTACAGNDPRLLTQAENDAAQGSFGAPSDANRFITEADPAVAKRLIKQASPLLVWDTAPVDTDLIWPIEGGLWHVKAVVFYTPQLNDPFPNPVLVLGVNEGSIGPLGWHGRIYHNHDDPAGFTDSGLKRVDGTFAGQPIETTWTLRAEIEGEWSFPVNPTAHDLKITVAVLDNADGQRFDVHQASYLVATKIADP